MLLAVCSGILMTACSDDDDHLPGLAEGEGEVIFQFVKNNAFDISKMEDIATIKVTVEKEGTRIVLPSLKISGEKDSLYSEPARLQKGQYKVISYQAFAANASLLGEIEPEDDTFITVEAGVQVYCYFPVNIKVIYINNTIKNVLLGICREVFGEDKSKWPWSEDVEDIAKWPNLEFQINEDTGEIMYLTDITFDEKFAPMKKVPSGLATLATVEGLVFKNLDLEELPDDLEMMNIHSLTLINTKLKKFPAKLSHSSLASIVVINSELTELPAALGELSETMTVLQISGSHLTTLPAEIGKLKKLRDLRITDSELTTLPDAFGELDHISHLDFSHNPALNSLPASISQMQDLRGLVLEGCGFSAVPEVVKQCTLLRNLWMGDNKLESVDAAVFSAFTQLEGLYLSGNRFSASPVLNCPTLLELALNNCGLTTFPDVSGLPELRFIQCEKNGLTTLPSACFAGNPKLVRFSLADNPSLASFPADLGIAVNAEGKPLYLLKVDVRNCPALQWTVPGNWCCLEVLSAEDIKKYDPYYNGGNYIIRRVIVDREGSAGVSREACPVCGSAE